MDNTFHKRCASALTHPATLAAPVVLLLNELLLKPLWSNPWTTGKLSEFAWMVFAPPLVAFLLSIPVGQRPKCQPVVFVIAYVGLPVLYFAFNTLEPVHSLVVGVLTIASESSTNAAPDYSDLLVVPFSLGVALWVWTRPSAYPHSLRLRLMVLTVGITLLASVAFSWSPRPHFLVGQTGSGILVLEYVFDEYISADGGLTWRKANGTYDFREVQWGNREVATPRGTHTIQDEGVIRLTADTSEVVYSSAYLQNDADARFQKYIDRRNGCYYGCPSSQPRNMVYHADTGNVVVSLGTLGVVVGKSDGSWEKAAVGWITPTDFSLVNKLRVVFGEEWIWLVLVAATLAISATALALASPRIDIYLEDMRPKLGCLAGVAAVLLISILTFVLLRDEFSGSELQGATEVLLPLVITLTPLAVVALWLQRGRIMGLGSVAYSILAAILALLVLPAVPSGLHPSEHMGTELVAGLCIGVSLFYGIIALIVFRPTRGQLSSVLAALLSMIALFALAFAIGIVQGFDLGAAKLYAASLILIAAFALRWHLRSQRSLPWRRSRP